MSTKRITAVILLIIGGVVLVFAYLGTNIRKILVVADSTFEPNIREKIEACGRPLINRSWIMLSDKEVEDLVKGCDPMVYGSTHDTKFPGELQVTADVVHPIVRLSQTDEDGGCILYETSQRAVERDAIGCIAYVLPEIKGANIPTDAFRIDYTIFIVSRAEKYGITISSVEEQGDTLVTWYKVILKSGVEVYVPQGEEGTKKIAALAAAIQGLENTGEKYRVIDLRFDRVVYR